MKTKDEILNGMAQCIGTEGYHYNGLFGKNYVYTDGFRYLMLAAEVMECLEQNCWKVEKFKVCGVNIGACVRSTVETLTYEYNQTVEVVKKACNGQENRSIAFKRNSDFYMNSPNVAVV